MSETEPRPREVSRRSFVKTTVAAGAVGAAAAAGALTLIPLSRVGERPPSFRYVGVKVLPRSKAPRGIPLIPVEANASGELFGRPDHLEWYKYCGRHNAPGLAAGFASDNVFRYAASPDVLQQSKDEGIESWWEPKLGQKALLSDFDEVGKGAPVIWRSDGQEAANPLTALLIRVDPASYDAEIAGEFLPAGVLGVFATCAHFCCVPTWRASRENYGEGHWDDITCHCHGSWYSVGDLVEYDFPPTG